jgi:hypothetical protein
MQSMVPPESKFTAQSIKKIEDAIKQINADLL